MGFALGLLCAVTAPAGFVSWVFRELKCGRMLIVSDLETLGRLQGCWCKIFWHWMHDFPFVAPETGGYNCRKSKRILCQVPWAALYDSLCFSQLFFLILISLLMCLFCLSPADSQGISDLSCNLCVQGTEWRGACFFFDWETSLFEDIVT
jgi:hypothetical protein